jgi:polar amino acid transport system substrate-binding protein
MPEPRSGRLAGCFDTLPDAQMLRDYLFHAKPLFSDPLLILARADRPVASVQVRDLENTSVVITHGYSYGGRI